MLVDVNVLVAAFRADHPHHAVARAWLVRALGAAQPVTVHVTTDVISSFIRITTNPRALPSADTSADAIAFVDWLLAHAKVEILQTGSEWKRFRELILTKDLTARHVPDGHLASICLHHSVKFATFDKGFRRLLPPSVLELLKA